MLVKIKDDLFNVIQAGHWTGLAPTTVSEVTDPANRWDGPKRTLQQHRQVLAFFEWSYAETKSEAMVHWFLNEEQGRWEPMPLPQRAQGMTVRIEENHPSYVPTFARLGAGWEQMGTDHHHCSSSAFQSGTDHSDEKGKEGLHLTIGNVGSGQYSLHARSSFRNLIQPVVLSDWYELDPAYQDLPQGIQDQILKHQLTTPLAAEFPEWWKENVLRTNGVTITKTWGENWTPSKGQQHAGWQTPSQLKGQVAHSWAKDMADDLNDFMKKFEMEPWGTLAWVNKLIANDELNELVKVMQWNYADLDDVRDQLRELISTPQVDETQEAALERYLYE